MTKYTKAKPFEFEGIHVYHDGLFGDISHHDTAATRFMDVKSNERIARAIHAFIEAESNVWHEDGSGFRKRRWFVVEEDKDNDPGGFTASHDDLYDYCYYYRPDAPDLDHLKPGQTDQPARAVVRDFLEWHTANYPKQPSEPTGLGAVVRVDGKLITRASISGGDFRWVSTGGLRYRWEEIARRGPVAVLSEGWTK